MSRETSVGNNALVKQHGWQVTAQLLAVLREVSDRRTVHWTASTGSYGGEIGAISRQAVDDALVALTDEGPLRRIQPPRSPAHEENRVGDNHTISSVNLAGWWTSSVRPATCLA